MRRYADTPGGPYDQPPETDPAPVECTNCGRLEECDCGGNDEPDGDNAREAEGER